MRIVLDTHAWIWWVTEDRRLSRKAKTAIQKSQREDNLWLSLISVWELAKRIEKRQLSLDRPLEQWLDQATTQTGLHLAELTRPILVDSCNLPHPFPGDPADQIIVATARALDYALATDDAEILAYPHVKLVWTA